MRHLGTEHAFDVLRDMYVTLDARPGFEFHRIGLSARGLYRRWGFAPRPEDAYTVVAPIIAPAFGFVNGRNVIFR